MLLASPRPGFNKHIFNKQPRISIIIGASSTRRGDICRCARVINLSLHLLVMHSLRFLLSINTLTRAVFIVSEYFACCCYLLTQHYSNNPNLELFQLTLATEKLSPYIWATFFFFKVIQFVMVNSYKKNSKSHQRHKSQEIPLRKFSTIKLFKQ